MGFVDENNVIMKTKARLR